jgi:hypothetical protein
LALCNEKAEEVRHRFALLKKDIDWIKRWSRGNADASQEFQNLTRTMNGSPAPISGKSVAQERLDELAKDPEWVKRFRTGGEAENGEFKELTISIAEAERPN